MQYRTKALKQRLEKLEAHHLQSGNTILVAKVDETGYINVPGNGYIDNSFYTYKQIEDLMNQDSPKLNMVLEQCHIKTVIVDDMAYVYKD